MPKFDFLNFDGSQPKYWLNQCKEYFELYGTEPHLWVRIAKMNFIDDAARWYPSVKQQLHSCSWPTFTSMILDRFGQEHHELLLRQLFQIRQKNTSPNSNPLLISSMPMAPPQTLCSTPCASLMG
jgi:hypothetical protein